MPSLTSFVSPLYSNFLPDFFLSEVEDEHFATCLDCRMCNSGNISREGRFYFDDTTKCCTYQPKIPNYLVGAILLDDDFSSAQGLIRKMVENKEGVHPLGLLPSLAFVKKYNKIKVNKFGREKSLVCPFLKDGLCSIWKYRNSVCSTWFCKHVSGMVGRTFWRSYRNYLTMMEAILSEHLQKQLGLFHSKMNILEWGEPGFNAYSNDNDYKRSYKKTWGEWEDNELRYYEKSYELLSAMDRKSIQEIIMDGTHDFFEVLRSNYGIMRNGTISPKLAFNHDLKFFQVGADSILLFDQKNDYHHEISPILKEILLEFDGKKTTTEIVELLKREADIELGNDLILYLQNNRILIES